MIKKILYSIMGLLLGVIVYLFLLSNMNATESAINVTTQKPVIESAKLENDEQTKIRELTLLNQEFVPAYDSVGTLLPHPSGYSYVYNGLEMPVGLIDDELLANINLDVAYDEVGNILPHSSGNEIAYSQDGLPVGLIVAGVFTFDNNNPAYDESLPIFANSYYLNNKDIKYYEDVKVVSFGQLNPMWYEVKEGKDPENVEEKLPPITYDEIDTLEIAADESVGYDTNVGDLKIVKVAEIESRITSEGKLPVDRKFYKVTSPFGPRIDPFGGGERFHVGLDLSEVGMEGHYVYSVLSGTVEVLSYNNGLGNYAIVSHGNFSTVYGHLEAFERGLKVGDEIRSGDSIGYVGNTGRSTGPHLHIEFDISGVKLNPERFLSLIN